MTTMRRITATLGAGALLAAPLTVLTAAPASADAERDREFRVAGAEVDFSVEKDDGRFEIDVDLDDARPGSRWKIVLRHDGKRFHKRVHRADRDGDIDIDKVRRNTAGKDVFKLKVKKIGGPKKVRTIRMR
ncbi:hypothetical protein CLV56_4092 [Mumia flava]|uniref:Secreted protein n=1 Tax=Mumia flava TaxID=1348852 RepID=A0A2M9AQB3_9ACTN|nr:hypothetical protein [Mumia flava]PJJ47833.1 hypothetical protein CLV56_4092 [Mumia flava]